MEMEPKNIALQRIREIVSSSGLSKEEVLSVLGGVSVVGNTSSGFHFNIVKILYFLGGFLALCGVVVFVSQFWEDLGFVGQVLVTLGFGFISYVSSLLLNSYKTASLASRLALVFSAILLPLGVTVILNEMSISDWLFASLWMAIGFFVVYFSTIKILQNDISRFLTIVSGTAIFFVSVALFVRESPSILETIRDFYSYVFIVYGVMCLALSSLFPLTVDSRRPLNSLLVFVETTTFLGALFSFSEIWKFVCLPGIAIFFYLSITMRSRIILTLSSIALMGYIGRITTEYFSNSLGWPITLMILGLSLIGIGYATFTFGKKYISTSR